MYLHIIILQSPLGFAIGRTDHIMELLNEWLSTIKFRRVDTFFRKDYTYEKELMYSLTLTAHDLHKSVMEYNDKFVHIIVRIQ